MIIFMMENKFKIIRIKNIKLIFGVKILRNNFTFNPIHITNYKMRIIKCTKHIYIGTALFKIELYLDISWEKKEK